MFFCNTPKNFSHRAGLNWVAPYKKEKKFANEKKHRKINTSKRRAKRTNTLEILIYLALLLGLN